jgi:hypothetical protein
MPPCHVLALGLLLLATPAFGSADAPTAPSRPPVVGFAPTAGALAGGLLVGAPSSILFVGSAIGFGGPAYHLLAFPALGPVTGMVLGDLIQGHSPGWAWGGALLGAAVGTAGGYALLRVPPLIFGLVGLTLLPPLGAVVGRGVVMALSGDASPPARVERPAVAWTLMPVVGPSGTGAMLAGYF